MEIAIIKLCPIKNESHVNPKANPVRKIVLISPKIMRGVNPNAKIAQTPKMSIQ